MKTRLILVLLLLAAFQGFSQKKKKADPKDVKIDSLTKVSGALALQLDSVSKSQQVYYGLYTTIKDKVLLHDFDPTKLSQIIDSIRVSRDSTMSVLAAPIGSLKDSVAMLKKENLMLRAKLDTLGGGPEGGDKSKLVAELKELKGLLDAKIITQAEYDAKKKKVMEKW
jgi:Short C-terminal domain